MSLTHTWRLVLVFTLNPHCAFDNFKSLVSDRILTPYPHCKPLVSGRILTPYPRECGGKMHLRESQYLKAHTDFFEAFKNYDESGTCAQKI